MKWQEFIKDYLTFTRKERIAILAIIFIVLLVVFFPKVMTSVRKTEASEIDSSWVNEIKKLEIKIPEDSSRFSSQEEEDAEKYQYDVSRAYPAEATPVLFFFDPNTLSEEGWKKLGLKEKTIRTLKNYLNKGGHFYKPEDLQKIYGLQEKEYEKLLPFIRIGNGAKQHNDPVRTGQPENRIIAAEKKNAAKYSVIDINTADTTSFISLPGIGSKLAARIVNFREKLGGFYSIDQIAETFGLPDSTFKIIKPFFKLENTSLRKININTATMDELKAHPYIKFSMANPLLAYRKEHGPFTNLEDLKKIPTISEEIFKKIAPYLTIE
ncbi:MAG: helix-hairpin-helix domain-containing protein [Chitinophagales bacterium]|nr:helix-hairpin-helix domain-containing protein [Chitinophagales bacterium]